MVRLIRADGIEAAPLAVVQALAQLEGSFVDGGSDRQRFLLASLSRVSKSLVKREYRQTRASHLESSVLASIHFIPVGMVMPSNGAGKKYDAIIIGGGHNGL